ncbi:hypothetical protein [Nonomuraea terrae]|uniref:hypothetical protein n=1 Tax=Nonomuraea terrae TaxID=2530383 RepID=UPI001CB6CD48|nr:hypothetical protein [Nonomuraea terrae]
MGSPEDAARESMLRAATRLFSAVSRHPEVPAPGMRRRPADASDIQEVESCHMQPLIDETAGDLAAPAPPAGADPLYAKYTMVWCVPGFTAGGVLVDGRRRGVAAPEQLRRSRAHPHLFFDRAPGLSGVRAEAL